MIRKEYTTLEKMQIEIMRDIFENLENPKHIRTLLENLIITDKQRLLLQMKYCDRAVNKTIAYKLKVSDRWFSSLLNEALLSSYNSLRYNLRNGGVVPTTSKP